MSEIFEAISATIRFGIVKGLDSDTITQAVFERLREPTEGRVMNEMVEQIAKALSDRRQVRAYGRVLTVWRAPEMNLTYIEERLDDATTAVGAMRVPTQAMVKAGYEANNGEDRNLGESGARECWSLMIDEALK